MNLDGNIRLKQLGFVSKTQQVSTMLHYAYYTPLRSITLHYGIGHYWPLVGFGDFNFDMLSCHK